MTTKTSNNPISEMIKTGIHAESTDLTRTLVDNEHKIHSMLEEDVLLFEFKTMPAAEEFADAAVEYIDRCTDHLAEVSLSCKGQSTQWALESREVFLPTLHISFADGRQVEGLLLTDINGIPYGVLVIACDKEAHLKDTVVRF